ncbi:MAG: Mur ligase domain-containing protein [bacterium]|nr:Mur ligase domain-containing protein [bacterium]
MKIFCSGIGGIGLSAYAALQAQLGHSVSGSDREDSALIHDLKSQGIPVSLMQDGKAVPDDSDLFVYSEAIDSDNPDRLRARELDIREISFFKALGDIALAYQLIAVCGTHGKSTTTAMAAQVLIDAGVDPTIIVGTKLPILDGRNWRKGESKVFLVEACEYRRNFLHLSPDIVLITNADGDHFDAFESVEDYRSAFVEFIGPVPDDGVIIFHGSDDSSVEIASTRANTLDADTYDLPTLSVPGKHMQKNAQLVLALAEHLHISDATESLQRFTGTWRRMEVKGDTADGVTVIDDYAHHPIEIAATISATKERYPGRRIVCVYQPHLHERTRTFYDAFSPSFQGVDVLVMSDIYEARSEVSNPVDTAQFAKDIDAGIEGECIYGGSLQASETLLRSSILRPFDVLIVMGAGDVTTVAEHLIC